MNPKSDLKTIASLPTDGVLLDYQKRWVADESDVKIAEKSRRIGLTWAEAGDDALYAASAEGDDVIYIGPTKEIAKEFINCVAMWAKHYQIAASEIQESVFESGDKPDKDILSYQVNFASGHKVIGLSSKPTGLRGRQGRCVIDEAAFHDDLPGLIKAAMAFLMWGGKVRIISTHNGDGNPYNELIKEARAGKKPYSVHRTTLDDALSDGLYKRICEVLGREWSEKAEQEWRQAVIDAYGEFADEELFCIPSQGSGVFFSRVLVESCMNPALPVLQWVCKPEFVHKPQEFRESECEAWCEENLKPLLDELDPDLNTFLGGDFGRTGDLSVFEPMQELKNLTYRVPFIVELSKVPFEQQKQVLFYIIDHLARFRGGALDARGNGQYLAEVAMQRYGEDRIHQVMITEKFYRDYMPKYKTMFEDRTIELPKSSEVVDDHRALRMIKGVAKIPDGKTSQGKGVQRHGDSAISGCMGAYAISEILGGEIEYETVLPGTMEGSGAY